ncbi:hypothetical protein KQX54_002529 [Cotesia glomerata]|uniref:Secreted protein n=1 Tax=Cotesia glomerata TaxID=32391 RepID=A0AAV7ILK2_COTGL|nr:hypothetical protein KQX54_002529 [Cotesia glomerata]
MTSKLSLKWLRLGAEALPTLLILYSSTLSSPILTLIQLWHHPPCRCTRMLVRRATRGVYTPCSIMKLYGGYEAVVAQKTETNWDRDGTTVNTLRVRKRNAK